MKKTIALAVLAAFMASPAFAEGDVASGEKVFKKCAACHAVGEGAKAKVGPVLNGLIGRTAGTNEEYASKYSKDMVEAGAGGLVWNDETLNTYLENPKGMIKKTKMSFAGLKKEEDRADVIAYLKTFTPAE